MQEMKYFTKNKYAESLSRAMTNIFKDTIKAVCDKLDNKERIIPYAKETREGEGDDRLDSAPRRFIDATIMLPVKRKKSRI